MIKIEAIVNGLGNYEVTVSGSDASDNTLTELDIIYRAFMGMSARRGTYLSTNKFFLEVKPEKNSVDSLQDTEKSIITENEV